MKRYSRQFAKNSERAVVIKKDVIITIKCIRRIGKGMMGFVLLSVLLFVYICTPDLRKTDSSAILWQLFDKTVFIHVINSRMLN